MVSEPLAISPPVVKAAAPPPLPKQGLNSIEKLKQEIALRKKLEAEQKPEEVTQVLQPIAPDTPVSKEIFEQVWKDFLASLREDKRMSLHAILSNAKWELNSEFSVEVTLASQHEQEMFDEERIHIVPFFRSSLKNSTFELTVKVVNTIIHSRAFTAEEKFNAMAEHNPLLHDLRKLLALDLE